MSSRCPSSRAPSPSGACVSLLECFAALSDTRKPRGVRYTKASVFALALVAILNGCKNPSQIYVFGKSRPAFLARLGFRPPKQRRKKSPPADGSGAPPLACPNEDTIAAILGSVAPEELNACLGLWLARQLPPEATAAVDGKALRGVEEHVLEVLVNDLRLVVWQLPVGDKENELSALEARLAAVLERFKAIRLLTGDAMFCHKSIARIIVKARRDYFLQLKSPHKTDVEIARQTLERKVRAKVAPLARGVEKRGARGGPSA